MLNGGKIQDGATISAGSQASGFGVIGGSDEVDGSAVAAGGALSFTGAINGSGTLTFSAGGTLRLGAQVGSSIRVVFNGPNETLQLGAQASFGGKVIGFGTGDIFSLNGQSVVSDVYNTKTKDLQLTGSSGTVFDLHLSGAYSQANFVLSHGQIAFAAIPPAASASHISGRVAALAQLNLFNQYMAAGLQRNDGAALSTGVEAVQIEHLATLAAAHTHMHTNFA
jgi:hypothetical protein